MAYFVRILGVSGWLWCAAVAMLLLLRGWCLKRASFREQDVRQRVHDE